MKNLLRLDSQKLILWAMLTLIFVVRSAYAMESKTQRFLSESQASQLYDEALPKLPKIASDKNQRGVVFIPKDHPNFKLVAYEDKDTIRVFIIFLDKKLGEGQFQVFLAQQIYADLGRNYNSPIIKVKILSQKPDLRDKKSLTQAEIDLLEQERNILELDTIQKYQGHFIYYEKKFSLDYFLFEDYEPGKNILEYLEQNILVDDELDRIAFGMMEEVRYAHKIYKITHGDIKNANFIIQKIGKKLFRIRLIDFDCSVPLDSPTYFVGGTQWYTDPLRFVKEKPPYTVINDLYSLGISMAEVLSKYNFQKYIKNLLDEWRTIENKELSFTPDNLEEAFPDIYREGQPGATTNRLLLINIIKRLTHRVMAKRYLPKAIDDIIQKWEGSNEWVVARKSPKRLRREQAILATEQAAVAPLKKNRSWTKDLVRIETNSLLLGSPGRNRRSPKSPNSSTSSGSNSARGSEANSRQVSPMNSSRQLLSLSSPSHTILNSDGTSKKNEEQ